MKNDFTRREFLTDSLLIFSLMNLPGKGFSSNISNEEPVIDNGLFFSKSEIPGIRENCKLPIFKDYWDSIVNIDFESCKKFINAVDLNNHVLHLAELWKQLQRSAFVSLIDDDKQHEEIARLSIKKILEFKEWDYFVEDQTGKPFGLQRGPETTIAMCLAYDWLGDKLAQTEKDAIITGIVEKGVPTCYNSLYYMRNPEKSKRWYIIPNTTVKFVPNTTRWPHFLNRTNLKFIPVAGLTFASVLLHGKHTDANKWLELSRWGVETLSTVYYEDGSYGENLGYWAYSTNHIILAIELLKRNLNIDYTKALNFKGTIKFALQMTAPFKNYKTAVANFSDCGFNPDVSAGFWVAKQFKDGLAQHAAETINGSRNTFAFIYYDKKIKPVLPVKKDLDVKFDLGWIVSRTGWTEEDSLLAFRSGVPANHEHADRNSFIFQAFGDRLLHDPMGAAYAASQKHWLLRFTESHNAVLIDGKGHFFHDGSEGTNMTTAAAKVLNYKADGKTTSIISDATQPYNMSNKDVKNVRRSLFFFKPDIIIILDEVEKYKDDSTIQARFHPFNLDWKAEVSTEGTDMFKIIRPYAHLYGKVYSNQKIKIRNSKLDIPEEELAYSAGIGTIKQVFPFVEASTVENSKKSTLISILSAQKSEISDTPSFTISKNKSCYLIEIDKHDGKFRFELWMNKKYSFINRLI